MASAAILNIIEIIGRMLSVVSYRMVSCVYAQNLVEKHTHTHV